MLSLTLGLVLTLYSLLHFAVRRYRGADFPRRILALYLAVFATGLTSVVLGLVIISIDSAPPPTSGSNSMVVGQTNTTVSLPTESVSPQPTVMSTPTPVPRRDTPTPTPSSAAAHPGPPTPDGRILSPQSEEELRFAVDGIIRRCPDIGDTETAFAWAARIASKLQSAGIVDQDTKFGNNNDPLVATAKILSGVAAEQSLMSLSARVPRCSDTYNAYLALRQQGQSPKAAMDALRETTDMERLADALEAAGY